MSTFNDTEWKKNDDNCISNAKKVKNYAKRFLPGWTFLGPGSEKRWYGDSHGGQWNRAANQMVQQFKETGHPIFTCTSALSRGILQQRQGKSTIHFDGDSVNSELLFKQFILVFASDLARWPNFSMQVRSGACPFQDGTVRQDCGLKGDVEVDVQ